jgi:hypothetical protein
MSSRHLSKTKSSIMKMRFLAELQVAKDKRAVATRAMW